jgi:transposase
MSSLQHCEGLVHIAFDTSKDVLVAGILHAGEETPTIERVFNDEPSIRRFLRGFPERSRLRTCYEAGPGGYELYRLLGSMKVPCEVIAPSLIPTAPGDRVKTDKRDARRLVRQFRSGELVAIRVPSREEEAVRDLCRARADAVEDLTRAKNRLGHFLVRHGRIYRDGTTWTLKHRSWLAAQSFDHPAATATFGRYRATVACREAELEAIEADMTTYLDAEPFCGPVIRGYRPIGAWTVWAPSCSRPRCATDAGSPGATTQARSAGSSPRSTPRGGASRAVASPVRATSTSDVSSSSPPGPTAQARASVRACGADKTASRLTPPLVPGPPRSTCAGASAPSTSASQCVVWWWRRSPDAWSATSTPRWSHEGALLIVRRIGQRSRPPVTELFVTRRGAAVAGTHPASSLRRLACEPKRSKSGAPSCELQTCVALAREYEIGGSWSIQSAAARHEDLGARSPPRQSGPGKT